MASSSLSFAWPTLKGSVARKNGKRKSEKNGKSGVANIAFLKKKSFFALLYANLPPSPLSPFLVPVEMHHTQHTTDPSLSSYLDLFCILTRFIFLPHTRSDSSSTVKLPNK